MAVYPPAPTATYFLRAAGLLHEKVFGSTGGEFHQGLAGQFTTGTRTTGFFVVGPEVEFTRDVDPGRVRRLGRPGTPMGAFVPLELDFGGRKFDAYHLFHSRGHAVIWDQLAGNVLSVADPTRFWVRVVDSITRVAIFGAAMRLRLELRRFPLSGEALGYRSVATTDFGEHRERALEQWEERRLMQRDKVLTHFGLAELEDAHATGWLAYGLVCAERAPEVDLKAIAEIIRS